MAFLGALSHWALTIDHLTARLFERIINDKPHPSLLG